MAKGIIEISPELLLNHLLKLDGYRLLDARYSHFTERLELVVESEAIPEVEEGHKYPTVTPIYEKNKFGEVRLLSVKFS